MKNKIEEGAAWTKKAGKNPKGGLNAKGRKSYERENPGSDLKAPQPQGGARKKSFCARMSGMRKRQKDSNNTGKDRLSLSLKKWNCSTEIVRDARIALAEACWKGYTAYGMKMKSGKQVPNCVPTKASKKKKAIKEAIFSLYEVSDPRPGRWNRIKDRAKAIASGIGREVGQQVSAYKQAGSAVGRAVKRNIPQTSVRGRSGPRPNPLLPDGGAGGAKTIPGRLSKFKSRLPSFEDIKSKGRDLYKNRNDPIQTSTTKFPKAAPAAAAKPAATPAPAAAARPTPAPAPAAAAKPTPAPAPAAKPTPAAATTAPAPAAKPTPAAATTAYGTSRRAVNRARNKAAEPKTPDLEQPNLSVMDNIRRAVRDTSKNKEIDNWNAGKSEDKPQGAVQRETPEAPAGSPRFEGRADKNAPRSRRATDDQPERTGGGATTTTLAGGGNTTRARDANRRRRDNSKEIVKKGRMALAEKAVDIYQAEPWSRRQSRVAAVRKGRDAQTLDAWKKEDETPVNDPNYKSRKAAYDTVDNKREKFLSRHGTGAAGPLPGKQNASTELVKKGRMALAEKVLEALSPDETKADPKTREKRMKKGAEAVKNRADKVIAKEKPESKKKAKHTKRDSQGRAGGLHDKEGVPVNTSSNHPDYLKKKLHKRATKDGGYGKEGKPTAADTEVNKQGVRGHEAKIAKKKEKSERQAKAQRISNKIRSMRGLVPLMPGEKHSSDDKLGDTEN